LTPYQLGSRVWPGLSKLTEEMGEVGQVVGKILGNEGRPIHYDGSDLIKRMGEEIADLSAATRVFIQLNGYDGSWVLAREQQKYHLFLKWHLDNLEDAPDDIPEKELAAWRRVLGEGSVDHYQLYWAWRIYPRAMFASIFIGVILATLPAFLLWVLTR
jgi:NTP pyrophosphatase (non-canonical NTP hydrolase)